MPGGLQEGSAEVGFVTGEKAIADLFIGGSVYDSPSRLSVLPAVTMASRFQLC